MVNEPRWPSVEWRAQVRNDAAVTHFQWRVADAVAERVDRRTGYAQFFQREIVKQLGCSIRGVHGALHQLIKLGHLKIQNLKRADSKLRYIPIGGVRTAVRTPCASPCAPDTHADSEEVRTAVRTKEPPREIPKTPPEGSISKSFEEEFWPFYPKRVSKGAARKAYERIIKSNLATVEELKLGAMRYAHDRTGQDPSRNMPQHGSIRNAGRTSRCRSRRHHQPRKPARERRPPAATVLLRLNGSSDDRWAQILSPGRRRTRSSAFRRLRRPPDW